MLPALIIKSQDRLMNLSGVVLLS